jgi:hypothetical protein
MAGAVASGRGSLGNSGELPWGLGVLYGPLARKTRGRSELSPCVGKTEDRESLVGGGGAHKNGGRRRLRGQ